MRHVAPRIALGGCALTLGLLVWTAMLGVLNQAALVDQLGLLIFVANTLVGALVTFHRPSNRIGWFFLGSTLCLAVLMLAGQYATYGLVTAPGALPVVWLSVWLQAWLYVPAIMLLLVFIPLYFPTGRLLSPHWRWLARWTIVVSIVTSLWFAFAPGEIKDLGLINPFGIEALHPLTTVINAIALLIYLPLMLAAAMSLIVRFRRSRREERQQIKWLAYAATMVPVWFLVSPLIEQALGYMVFRVIDGLVFSSLPVAAGIAILHYRLYDIDLIINRTLVYGALTALLAAIYVGSVVLLQRSLAPLIGSNDQIAIVASTLAIAALFNPLRRRIQAITDQRFYRRKYDAQKTVQAFRVRMRDETDLDQLTSDLVQVVQDTVQPAHVSLWLCDGELRSAAQRSEANSSRVSG